MQVFEGLDLTIEAGSFVAVLGHNGCGKSTLAKHYNAILLPTGGSVHVYGMDTRDEALLLKIRQQVGMVFQNPDNQIVSNVVEEDVAFAPENLGVPPEEIRTRVDEALKLVGMFSTGSTRPICSPAARSSESHRRRHCHASQVHRPGRAHGHAGSPGQARGAGHHSPPQPENHITAVLITHHMPEAVLADRVVVMTDGGILTDGTPKEVFSQVELLRAAGLTVPETTMLLYELRQAGFDLRWMLFPWRNVRRHFVISSRRPDHTFVEELP